jgi:hypothetical protein
LEPNVVEQKKNLSHTLEIGQSGKNASDGGDFQHSNLLDMNESIFTTPKDTGPEDSILSVLKEKFKLARFTQLSALDFDSISRIFQGPYTEEILIEKFNKLNLNICLVQRLLRRL